MSVMKQIEKRYSVRAYQDKPVEEEKLNAVLEAARLSPSARNCQDRKFVVVTDPALREKLVPAANGQKFVGEAPVTIACCATVSDHVMRCGQTTYPIDLAIAIDHMTLQAVEEGLGTCWIGSFFPDQVREILGIPEDIEIVELMTLGYPADEAKGKDRKAPSEIISYNKW